MSLLGKTGESRKTKAVEDRLYNAEYTYGPAGGITPSEFSDIKEGDYDRETGAKKCVWCRQAKPLKTGNGTTCDAYCERSEYGWVPVGRPHKWDKGRRGREWLTLG